MRSRTINSAIRAKDGGTPKTLSITVGVSQPCSANTASHFYVCCILNLQGRLPVALNGFSQMACYVHLNADAALRFGPMTNGND